MRHLGSVNVAGDPVCVRRQRESGLAWGSPQRSRRLALLSTSALASLLLGATAFAADLPLKAPSAIVADSWAGPYIGAYFAAGGGRAQETLSQSNSVVTAPAASLTTGQSQGAYSGNVTGSMVDLVAGRNWRFGRFVVGGQAEVSVASDIDLNERGPLTTNTVNPNIIQAMTATNGNDPQLRFRAALVGRGGYLVQPNLLVYGLAGLEVGHFFFPDTDFQIGGLLPSRDWAAGVTAGAGLEARLDSRWSLRAEYRYLHYDLGRSASFGSTTVDGASTTAAAAAVSRHDSADIQLAKLGLIYRFGEAGPLAAMAALPGANSGAQPDGWSDRRSQPWSDRWAGPYAGFAFGAGRAHVAETSSFSSTSVQTFPATPGAVNETFITSSYAGNGGMAGSMNAVFAGYNWRVGNVVAGAQVDGSLFSDMAWQTRGPQSLVDLVTTNGVPTFGNSSIQTTTLGTEQLRSTVNVLGRAGVLVRPDLLLYGLAGVSFGNFVFPDGQAGFNVANGPGNFTNSQWVAGWTAGLGGEWRLDDHWSVRAEYRYQHFDVNRTDSTTSSAATLLSGVSSLTTASSSGMSRAAVDLQLGQIGFAYKFGGASPASAMAAMPPVIPQAVVSSWNDGWAGPYIGIAFGSGAGIARGAFNGQSVTTGTQTTPPSTPVTIVVPQTDTTPFRGSLAGSESDLFAGYSVRNGRVVWGGQVEVTQFSDLSVSLNGVDHTTTPTQTLDITDQYRNQLRSMVGLVGRAGYLVRPDLLVYGLAGLELGHITQLGDFTADPVQNGKWIAGFTAGAGAEYKLTDHWSLRGEYRYVHFNTSLADQNLPSSASGFNTSGSGIFITSNTVTNASRQASFDFQLGKIGLAYRFGGDNSSAMAAFADRASPCCDRWSGFSAGIYGAGGAGSVRDVVTSTATAVQTAPTVLAASASNTNTLFGDSNGGTVDLFAGYNRRLGDWVVGGQAEGTLYSSVGLRSSTNAAVFNQSSVAFFNGAGAITDKITQREQVLGSRIALIGRGGYLVQPDLLLYGLAGLEFGHFAYPDEFSIRGGDNGVLALGFTVGAGAEWKLTDHWSLRGEYRYLRFGFTRGDSSEQVINTPGVFDDAQFLANSYHTSVDLHLAKFGVAYGF